MVSKGPNRKSLPPIPSSSSEEEEERVAAANKSMPKPKPSQLPPSSSEEEEAEEEEEEEEEERDGSRRDEEEEDTVHREQISKNQPQSSSNDLGSNSSAASSSESEGKREWESELESPEKRRPVIKIKLIRSKPMDDSSDKKQDRPHIKGTTAASFGRKRHYAPSPSAEDAAKKRKTVQRVWREDDEIRILHGILAFHSERGTDAPSSFDMEALHEFMQRFIDSKFTKLQLSGKIRYLKKKHDMIAARGKKGAKPQEQGFYEVAARVWGAKNTVAANGKLEDRVLAKHAKKKKVSFEVDYEFLGNAVAKFGDGEISRSVLDKVLRLVDAGKATALEKHLRELELAKLKNYLQWLYEMQAAVELIADNMRKSRPLLGGFCKSS